MCVLERVLCICVDTMSLLTRCRSLYRQVARRLRVSLHCNCEYKNCMLQSEDRSFESVSRNF
jgi:hypothetical protein